MSKFTVSESIFWPQNMEGFIRPKLKVVLKIDKSTKEKN